MHPIKCFKNIYSFRYGCFPFIGYKVTKNFRITFNKQLKLSFYGSFLWFFAKILILGRLFRMSKGLLVLIASSLEPILKSDSKNGELWSGFLFNVIKLYNFVEVSKEGVKITLIHFYSMIIDQKSYSFLKQIENTAFRKLFFLTTP